MSKTTTAKNWSNPHSILAASLLWILTSFSTSAICQGQVEPKQESNAAASAGTEASSDQRGPTIIIEAGKKTPELAFLYSAQADATVRVTNKSIEQNVSIQAKVIQGTPKFVVLELIGPATVDDVQGDGILSWAVRREGAKRYLELLMDAEAKELSCKVSLNQAVKQIPSQSNITHFGPADAIGFSSQVAIDFDSELTGKLTKADGFTPMQSKPAQERLQTTSGGELTVALQRRGADLGPILLSDVTLDGQSRGEADPPQSIAFTLTGKAVVREAPAQIRVLSGQAAIDVLPSSADYRLRLVESEGGVLVYELAFDETGEFDFEIDFVAPIRSSQDGWQVLDFAVATSAVVPFTMEGLSSDLSFAAGENALVPVLDGEVWSSFLPATGRVVLRWKNATATEEGKLFFRTTALNEALVGPGMLREEHTVDYKVLQGKLPSLELNMKGPGEILSIDGPGIVAWTVEPGESDDEKRLAIKLNQPASGSLQLRIRTQTSIGAFPTEVSATRFTPVGSIRHAGHLRLRNAGSVRIETKDLQGLTQLSPEQFPGPAAKARQTFVYGFPSAEYALTIMADRIQPEVNVAELVTYSLSESERTISANLELDIREAPIRDWTFQVPADYSVVAVSGPSIADYVVSSTADGPLRDVKLVFADDIAGRQLVTLMLEKSETVEAGTWALPRLNFPNAESVRGDLGVAGAPGYRLSVESVERLAEKPLSYFPNPVPNLQQAFRIREPDWQAALQVELLERSVQSDVFHLYSLSQGTVYGSALVNYFIAGAPTSEWRLTVPTALDNIMVDGQDIRNWRREGDTLIVALHQPVMGPYTLLVTFEQKPDPIDRSFQAGLVEPLNVQGDRGYIQVVSPMQVELKPLLVSPELLVLDPLELPAEFRLLSTAPPLGTWQYTQRPLDLKLQVDWFQPGTTATQVVEFSEANSRVSADGELVTDLLYYVKSRGQRTLRIQLPKEPVRLWAVSVNDEPVNARTDEDATLIPLPGEADPNVPVVVKLRLGKPAVDADSPDLALPIVFAPVLKTEWNITGDENHTLIPTGGPIQPAEPVVRPTGYEWLARNGLFGFACIAVLVLLGCVAATREIAVSMIGAISLAAAIFVCCSMGWNALEQIAPPKPLQMSLPVLSAGEEVAISVANVSVWWGNVSWLGAGIAAVGLILLAASFLAGSSSAKSKPSKSDSKETTSRTTGMIRLVALASLAAGTLMQRDGAAFFFGLLALVITFGMLCPILIRAFAEWSKQALAKQAEKKDKAANPEDASNDQKEGEGGAPVVATILTFIALSIFPSQFSLALEPWYPADEASQTEVAAAGRTGIQIAANAPFQIADVATQDWSISLSGKHLKATASMQFTGLPGDQFLLLQSPAVLTKFDGKGLFLSKQVLPTGLRVYVVTIRDESAVDAQEPDGEDGAGDGGVDSSRELELSVPVERKTFNAEFAFQLESLDWQRGIPALVGQAAIQKINLELDAPNWNVSCAAAVEVQTEDGGDKTTKASLLLGPNKAVVSLQPQARDISAEETKFFVEVSNLYTVGPGVVDGRHRVRVRTAQGKVSAMTVNVPSGLTVSEVAGKIASWQFDADARVLKIEVDQSAGAVFDVIVDTQRGLDALPTQATLAPVFVEGASGEIGFLAIAFGPDAQPESVAESSLSPIGLSDFDRSLMTQEKSVLHRAYRYESNEANLVANITEVTPEVRVTSRQVVSLGDERIVLAINFATEITRAGLFQLTVPVPDGYEVESLSGEALDHWSEVSDDDGRRLILHLKGKTLGSHQFSLSMTGPPPEGVADWSLPRFEIGEANRQTGDLVVRPMTGIRLRTIDRQNVSEVDPRSVGGQGQGALAFRLLQNDWSLNLGIEQLAPWVTGQVLHEITLREGQTRTNIFGNFLIQNASVRSLQVRLPISDEAELKSIRMSGGTISDFVRTAPDSDIWRIDLKRRVIGRLQFQLEYERRGDRATVSEVLEPLEFPDTKQVAYFFGIRAGGRLDVEYGDLTQGWQIADWSNVPGGLRESGNRNAPAITLRAVAPPTPLAINATRHSLADALKLRVASGELTTVLSPTGDQLTSVDVTMEVIQRSSLTVILPEGGELFSIFVNGESVHSIRQTDNSDAWQFYILPGMDDRTATVRFVYSVTGKDIQDLQLVSPQLNVPLENVKWNVIAPLGFELSDNDGNLELIGSKREQNYDRGKYLSKVQGKLQSQAQQAADLLEQANQLLQAGEQTKARWALNSVANQYALDAASNEDARVQLENLQTQQAIVGLNTRRQRLFLYNSPSDSIAAEDEQLRQAAAANPILQQDQLKFRPQELSSLLGGNSNEDNAILQQIAARLVQHQRTTEPAPQAIIISVPEEGTAYSFSRSVQVAENAPLELDLQFASKFKPATWQLICVALLLGFVLLTLAWHFNRQSPTEADAALAELRLKSATETSSFSQRCSQRTTATPFRSDRREDCLSGGRLSRDGILQLEPDECFCSEPSNGLGCSKAPTDDWSPTCPDRFPPCRAVHAFGLLSHPIHRETACCSGLSWHSRCASPH